MQQVTEVGYLGNYCHKIIVASYSAMQAMRSVYYYHKKDILTYPEGLARLTVDSTDTLKCPEIEVMPVSYSPPLKPTGR
ncbi:MAG TPA: hypothetical protein VF868_02125 [Bacteroidia bacterium]